jgi:hypothetical protein
MIAIRKSLVLVHRYLGIVLSLFFVMWFATGIGMIYSRGMPRLTPEVRLARLSAVDFDRVRLTPVEAAERAGLEQSSRTVLLTLLDRPAYRFGNSDTVFADNGELFGELDLAQAKTLAARFVGVSEDKVQLAAEVTQPDQWTLTQGRQLPLYKMAIDDAAHTEVYVSPRLGEIVQLTTRGSRALAWVSTIPHFFYYAPLRMKGELWFQSVVWIAGLACVLSLAGIVIGIMAFKRSHLPYSGLMRWHYVTGLVFGVLTLTFAFSGLMSMEPWAWTERDELERGLRQALTGGSVDLSTFPPADAATWRRVLGDRVVKEVEFARLMDEPYYLLRDGGNRGVETGWPDGGHQPYFISRDPDRHRLVVSAKSFEPRAESFAAESIVSRLKSVKADAPVVETTLLSEYDTYYYSRDGQAPLPVLRVKFDDPDKTWLYVDPEVAQVVGQVNRLNRVERWLYNAFHTLDFSFLYYNRPLWDGVVIVLSLGGLAVSTIGLVMGIKRVRRSVRASTT